MFLTESKPLADRQSEGNPVSKNVHRFFGQVHIRNGEFHTNSKA